MSQEVDMPAASQGNLSLTDQLVSAINYSAQLKEELMSPSASQETMTSAIANLISNGTMDVNSTHAEFPNTGFTSARESRGDSAVDTGGHDADDTYAYDNAESAEEALSEYQKGEDAAAEDLGPQGGTQTMPAEGGTAAAPVIYMENNHMYLQCTSPANPRHVYRFKFSAVWRHLQTFRCCGCLEAANSCYLPTAQVRTIKVKDGHLLDNPDRPGGHEHICLRPLVMAARQLVVSAEAKKPVVGRLPQKTKPAKRLSKRKPRAVLHNFGKATFRRGYQQVVYQSRRYPDHALAFNRMNGTGKPPDGRRVYYKCAGCAPICSRLKSVGVKQKWLSILNGEIVDHDPDDAGSSMGHLCQQPNVVADLQKALANKANSESPYEASTAPTPEETEDAEVEVLDIKPAIIRRLAACPPAGTTSATPTSSTNNNTPVPSTSGVLNAGGGGAVSSYSVNFGKATYADGNASSVLYESIYGVNYTFKVVGERRLNNGSMVRTYQCEGCLQAASRAGIKLDVPLVKTVNDYFVERDPDRPLGNDHLCMQ